MNHQKSKLARAFWLTTPESDKLACPHAGGARLINLAARPQWVESQGTSHSRGIVNRRKKPQSREKAGVAL
jgi:hypothetical protein